MKRFLFRTLLPWTITVVALYLAFRGVEWDMLFSHARSVRIPFVAGAITLTVISYVLRSARWPLLCPDLSLPFSASLRVLVLGFFMNNVLPARAGELVRAHLGAKVVGKPRTLMLATIASERLADGLMLSLMFAGAILLFGRGHLDPEYAQNLLYVAYLFVGIAVGVLTTLFFRERIYSVADSLTSKTSHRASKYALSRMQLFIHGLSPLCSLSSAARITVWTIVIWLVELGAFMCVAMAYDAHLSLFGLVLFLVSVNFSSLVPAAPGGFGVIELVAKSVLMSLGIESSELALCIVLTQHVIQYAVIGIPGAYLLSTLRSQIQDMSNGALAVSE
jgi:glycosyltransferase 2 family protein